MNTKQTNLKKVLSAKIILFIGSKKIIKQGIRNCLQMGFPGKILVVHPTEPTMEGFSCYKDIPSLPVVPDAAFIAVNKQQTISVVGQLRDMGTSGVVCYAAGFAESGDKDLQHDLIKAAGDMVLVGPNCYGLLNFLDNTALWPDYYGGKSVAEGAAIISQSGNLSMNLTMSDRTLPLAYMISAGNQASLGIGDYMEALIDDPRVKAIGIYMEGLGDIETFNRAAEKAFQKGIPIVALKSGKSDTGSQLTMSHTSSLAGSDQFYDALFARLHIVRVHTLSDLTETLKLFCVSGLISGKNLGVLTCSGGESTIVADFAAEYAFNLPALTDQQSAALEQQLTQFEHISNPLDYNTSIWGNEPELVRCFQTFMEGNFDLTILVLDYLIPEKNETDPWRASINAIIKAKQKVICPAAVISTFTEGIPKQVRDSLIEHGVTPLQGVSEAFTALNANIAFSSQQQKINIGSYTRKNLLLPAKTISTTYASVLNEWEGKQLLTQYGLQTPKGRIINNPFEELNGIEDVLNPPYVVKVVNRNISHKSDIGAVKVNVKDQSAAEDAIRQMNKDLTDIPQNEKQYLVEEMIQHSLAEMTVGIKRDPQFGPALVVGTGGELVNFLNDSAIIMLPAHKEDICTALQSLKGFQLLEGFRGRPKGDIQALIHAVHAIALFTEQHYDDILEMDVNPILVLPEGEGVVAVDAFVRMVNNKTIEIG